MLTNENTNIDNSPLEEGKAPDSAETLKSGLSPETKKVIAVATGIGVASAGIGLTTGTAYSEEIKENIGKVEEVITGTPATNTAEAPVVTPVENIVSISHSTTDADGVIHTVELIDCDADSIADDVTITQLEPDGSYITMGGDLNLLNPLFYEQTGENSNDQNVVVNQEEQNGITYTIELHDYDMDGIIDDGNVTVVGPNDFYVQENLSAEVIDGFSSLDANYAKEEEYGALGLNSEYEMSDVNELSGTNYEPINWEDFSEVSQESEYMLELNDTNFDNYSSSEVFITDDSAIAGDIL
ncbi:MAG: hypothetical protein ACOYN9_15130 [Saprospiraceae bacterium]